MTKGMAQAEDGATNAAKMETQLNGAARAAAESKAEIEKLHVQLAEANDR